MCSICSTMQQVVSNIMCENVLVPIQKVLAERQKKSRGRQNKPIVYRSIYREILFLIIVALGEDRIDISKQFFCCEVSIQFSTNSYNCGTKYRLLAWWVKSNVSVALSNTFITFISSIVLIDVLALYLFKFIEGQGLLRLVSIAYMSWPTNWVLCRRNVPVVVIF